MKKTCVLAVILCLMGSSMLLAAAPIVVPAEMSCRTEGGANSDVVRRDSNKLSVRRTANGNKSWIRFNLSSLGLKSYKMRSAVLTIAMAAAKSGTQQVDISFVNNACLDNITWTNNDITWNNAPGNNTADLGLLNASKTTLVQTLPFANVIIGDSFNIDVQSAFTVETDGIVQFVLHNSPNLVDFATHTNATVAYRPYLTIIPLNPGADYPAPERAAEVETSLAALSWKNPDPNIPGTPITCDVYLGTDPNTWNKVSLGANINTVAINSANFPTYGNLINNKTYYWKVDCHDTTAGLIPGEVWTFVTNNNQEPEVDAGADQAVWLGKSGVAGQEVVALTGTTKDDGLPKVPGTYTKAWTQVSGPAVSIANANQDVASVTVTAVGTYEFMLTANDGNKQTADNVTVFVGNTACAASHLSTGAAYTSSDINQDCIVDLNDFMLLIAVNWMNCTDTLSNCIK